MTTANLNGVELFFETAGTGDRLVLVHGSWVDALSWGAVVGPLADRFEVVTWDRRGHSRSQDGDGPGSLHQDADDLAALIEHLGDSPVHLVGNSYGASVALTLVASRPDLVATASVHEPPLFALLEGTEDERISGALSVIFKELESVFELLGSGDHLAASRYFVEAVAFGPGAWDQLPEALRQTYIANAATYLDESRDPEGLSIDGARLAAAGVPILLSYGTESPSPFPAVIRELSQLVPNGRVDVLTGTGHVPQITHPDIWITSLVGFHDRLTIET